MVVKGSGMRRTRLGLLPLLWVLGSGTLCLAQEGRHGPADPQVRDPAMFDARRPVDRELETHVPDGFTVAAVGDLIISRPLSQYAATLPAFKALLDLLRRDNVVYGNLETAIFDPRSFSGSPYSWDGDWTNAALPAVARDLKAMGFNLVSRANNHALDWGPEGMRETSRWLDDAGIVYAGIGEYRGQARAPAYLETSAGRVALVSIASTFRPTTDALPSHGTTPGRPGINPLHVTSVVNLPARAMRAAAEINCALNSRACALSTDEITLFGSTLREGEFAGYTYTMDSEDLAEIYRSIRTARQSADFVIVAIHSHECSTGCDDDASPRGAGNFLRQFAHDAIDSGADVFVTTGNHNVGAIEIYNSPGRGKRPIFYGLGNFFWSDLQEAHSYELFQGNRALLAKAWADPTRATDYDLTAPLNKASFANTFTFESILAECQFEHAELARITLRPVEEGYGSRLLESGLPRLVSNDTHAADIIAQIAARNAEFGLPALNLESSGRAIVVKP